MKSVLLNVVLVCLVLPASAQPDPPAPSAEALLRAVIDQLPNQPLRIEGGLRLRRRRGVVVREVRFELSVDWGRRPSVASYTIRDMFGRALERLVVRREQGNAAQFEYARGDPLTASTMPPLSASVQGTDFTWAELTLAALWWQPEAIEGIDSVKGRDCYVVSVVPPPSSSAPYARARLWIDRKLSLLVQAEGYDRDGAALRRLWVRSLKKIDGRWMVKDLEAQTFPGEHRTRLFVNDAGVLGQQTEVKPPL